MINLFIRFIIFFCFTGLLYSEEDFEIPRYEELEAIESLQSQAKVESMSLAELEEYATNNNPLYLAAKKDLGIARSGVLSAAIRHNPILYFEQQFIQSKAGYSAPLIGSLGGDAGGGVESAPKISYEFDLSGIRNQNIKLARQEYKTALSNFSNFDRLFRLRLRQNYWYYLYITNLVDTQEEVYNNYIDLLKLSRFRVSKGDISQLEYDRLELEKVRIERNYRNVNILKARIARNLRVLVGIDPEGRTLKFKDKLIFRRTEELGLDLENYNIQNRPDYQAMLSETHRKRLEVELEEKKGGALPYLSVGAELRFKTGETFAGIFAQTPLKVFDRNQGGILKSKEKHRKSLLKLQSKKNEIIAEIVAAKRELLAREEILREYESMNLVEKNKQVQEKYRLAYNRGASNLVTFLEAERNYLSVQNGYNEQMYLYYNAIETYRAAIGKLGK